MSSGSSLDAHRPTDVIKSQWQLKVSRCKYTVRLSLLDVLLVSYLCLNGMAAVIIITMMDE